MAELGYSTKLQIVVVPSGKTYTTPDNKTGLLIFREGSNTIEVNGHPYKATSAADLTAIINALKNTGYLTEDAGGVLTANNPGTVAALLGTKIATASGEGVNTVSGWIDSLQSNISTINTNITNLQNATKTDGSGDFVVRDKTGEGKTDFANTTAIQTAINTAKTGAEQTAAADATSKVNTAKSDLIGTGVDSTDAEATALNPGTGKTWAVSEANTKTLSHLKDLILDLQGQINTLSGTNLQNVIDDIAAIEQELANGEGTGLTTIIDGLKLFLGSGLDSNGATHTVNGVSDDYTLQQIINALETEINARIASVDKGSGETLIDVTTDNSTKAVTISSTNALTTAVQAANSAIQSVDEASGETLIDVTTNNKAVTVSSTNALTTAVQAANAAMPKGASSYADAAALETGLKGNASDTMNSTTIEGAKKYADSKSLAAQDAAVATAKSYADSVISWTVIE